MWQLRLLGSYLLTVVGQFIFALQLSNGIMNPGQLLLASLAAFTAGLGTTVAGPLFNAAPLHLDRRKSFKWGFGKLAVNAVFFALASMVAYVLQGTWGRFSLDNFGIWMIFALKVLAIGYIGTLIYAWGIRSYHLRILKKQEQSNPQATSLISSGSAFINIDSSPPPSRILKGASFVVLAGAVVMAFRRR